MSREDQILSLERLVRSTAHWFLRRVPPPDRLEAAGEMIQEAWMAAIKAVDSYDARRGVPLGGFASQRIRGAILDYMRSLHWYRHRRQSSAFHPELPLSCANEIADEQADKAREAFHSHHYLAKLMQCLPLTEKHVTQRLLSVQAVQIAAEMGIGEARVSQIRKRAVERMRAAA